MLTDARAQRREGYLDHRIVNEFHLERCVLRIDDAIPHDRIDLDRHVVLGNRLLLFDCRRQGTHVDGRLPFDQRDDPIKPRPPAGLISAEAENDGALVLVGDAQAGQPHDDNHDDDYVPHLDDHSWSPIPKKPDAPACCLLWGRL